MELSHSLTLNEEALAQLPDGKKSLFVYEWLRFLENVLVAAQKVIVHSIYILMIFLIYFLFKE